MKPNFALSLSFEGIKLLRRMRGGWDGMGEVSAEAEDLPQALAALRKAALATGEPLRSKIILPNDQIRYLALANADATEDDVRAALDGATPYAVADLVFDFVSYGGLTRVAAVARETLEEAEAFAVEHQFEPVSFVAEPEDDSFPGEPFFGTTSIAADLIGKRAKVQRDRDPSKMAPPTEAVSEATPPDHQPEPSQPAEATAPDTVASLTEIAADDTVEPEEPQPTLDAPQVQSVTVPEVASVPAPEAAPEPEIAEQETPPAAPLGVTPLAKDRPMPREVVLPPSPRDDNSAVSQERDADQDDTAVNAASTKDLPGSDPETGPSPAEAPPPARPPGVDFAAKSKPEPESQPEPEPEPEPESIAARDTAPTPETPPAPADEPVFSSRLAGLRIDRRPPPGDAPRIAPVAPPVPSTSRPVDAEPAFSRVAHTLAQTRDNPSPAVDAEPRDRPQPNLPRPAAALPGAGPAAKLETPARSGAPIARKGPSVPEPSDKVKAALMAAVTSPGRVDFARPPAALGASLTALPDRPAAPITPFAEVRPVADARGGLFASRRKRNAAEKPPATKTSPPDERKTRRESGLASALGARKADAPVVGGKPRFLGLILTAILLFCLAGVAAWATLSQGGFSALFGGTAPAPVSAPEPATSSAAEETLPAAEAAQDTPELSLPPPAEEDTVTAPEGVPLAVAPDADTVVEVAAPDAPDETVQAETPPATEAAGEVPSPAAADRFYAATGVWLRAPRLPLTPQSEAPGDLPVAVADIAIARTAAPTLPDAGTLSPDVTLASQPVPPALDARFARDARGFLLATPEGTVTPDGLLIFAGSPSVIPPTRPNTPAPTPEAAASPGADGVADPGAPVSPEDALNALAVDPDTPVTAASSEAGTVTAGGVALAGLRPPLRPEGLAPETPAPPTAQIAFAGPRPNLRPEGLAPPPVEPPEEVATEAAPEPETAAPDVETTLAAIVATAPDPLATATPQAVARASRPDARPSNFARVVSQAEARTARAQPTNNGGIAPTALAPSEGSAPEQVSSASAAPTGPVPTSVASAATIDNAINLRSINLIGVYGRPNERRALVRLGNGRYVRVGVGDRLDGGQVNAIGDNALNYVKNGRTLTLQIPSG